MKSINSTKKYSGPMNSNKNKLKNEIIFIFYWYPNIGLKSYLIILITNSLTQPVFIGVMILLYLFETYLDLRQYAVLKLPTLPLISQGAISPERFRKFRAHSIDKRLHINSAFIFFLVWF